MVRCTIDINEAKEDIMSIIKESFICAGIAALILIFACSDSFAGTDYKKAYLAGGCFWCMTPPYEKLGGVIKVVSGYAGGKGANPTYEDYEDKGYIEAVEVTFDPSIITYEQILNVYWRQINPTDSGGQFCDRGPQYRPIIFYSGEEQKRTAEKTKAILSKSGKFKKTVTTEIIPETAFYPAEEYHQDYYKKNPVRYKYYRFRCGRDQYLEKIWGAGNYENDGPLGPTGYVKPSRKELEKSLTPLQYRVTQEGATEPSFDNKYWNNKEEGIYVDIVSGEPLFSSKDKFDSGTGWPSFTRPMVPGNVTEIVKGSFFSSGIEVRSLRANSHLGDLFFDGPPPTGLRYCLDSAALRFIPLKDMAKKGYGEFVNIFTKK